MRHRGRPRSGIRKKERGKLQGERETWSIDSVLIWSTIQPMTEGSCFASTPRILPTRLDGIWGKMG